ncbi:MAG: ROK family protein [Phycisphaeraceae bacterium]|nr:ROK family protein [Phycisphaeraceae bacterium]
MAKAGKKKKKVKTKKKARKSAKKASAAVVARARSGRSAPARAERGGRGGRGLVVGIDLGGTNMQIGVVSPDNTLLGREGKKTQVDKGTRAIMQRLSDGVEEVCRQAGVSLSRIAAVGIGAPGAIDPATGVVLEAPNLRWNKFPLAKTLSAKLGGARVVVGNDVNVAVYGEWKLGAGRGCDELLGVWLGTGVGGGLIFNGALYEGHFKTAGEIGHMPLVPAAPLGRSTLEQNCSRTAISERLAFLIRANHKSVISELTGGDLGQVRSKVIAQAYRLNDALTVRVLDEAGEMLGRHVGGLITLLSLRRVILGGGLTEALGEPWVRKVRKVVRESAFPARCGEVEVVASELEDDAGLLGAALLARQSVAK